MPLGFQIYPDLGFLFIRAQGVITQEERVQTMLALLEDPGYTRCVDALFDITRADSTPKLSDLRQLITILQQRMPGEGPRKLAIVTGKPITFAVAQEFEGLVEARGLPLQVKVFHDRDEAWHWLRPDEEQPGPR
jgi:SpoIIAA-like